MHSVSRSRKQKPAPSGRSPSRPDAANAVVTRSQTIDLRSFLAERERRGARIADIESFYEESLVIFGVSEGDPISGTCIDCMELVSSAARNAASAIAVLDRSDYVHDAHLRAALKKYVEDTGEALKQLDKLLKDRCSSLVELLPDLSDGAEDTTTWKELIGRRDVIAHKILTIDDNRVRDEADQDFRTLYSLLRNISFVPNMTDVTNGLGIEVSVRVDELHRLPPITPESNVTAIGASLILVHDDFQLGLQTLRLARSPDNELLIAASHVSTPT